MLISYRRAQTGIVLRVKLLNSSVSTGAGLQGLTSASSGLVISTIANNEATPTVYTVAGSTIESITALGTYATPTATKCRFKEVSSNHPGIYEIQLADARFAVSNAKSLIVSISGATNCAETDVLIPLTDVDPYDAAKGGMTNLDAAITSRMATYTQPTGFLAAAFPAAIADESLIIAATTSIMTRLGAPVGASVSADIAAIASQSWTVLAVPEVIDRPAAGTTTYTAEMFLYDQAGNMHAPDAAPTVTLTNTAGTDRSGRLGSTTGTLVATGHYKWVYTNTFTDALEQLHWQFSVTEATITRVMGQQSVVVGDRTGYSLAPTGLDEIPVTMPTSVAATFREMIIATWAYDYQKSVYDPVAQTLTTYAANGSTVLTTAPATIVSGVETKGKAV